MYFGSKAISAPNQTVLLGGYFTALGLLGLFAKVFFFKIPFLSEVVSVENSYRILNSILFAVGLIFILNHWLKMFS